MYDHVLNRVEKDGEIVKIKGMISPREMLFDQPYPYELYAKLKDYSPRIKMEGFGWIFTEYNDVNEILKDNRFEVAPPAVSAVEMLFINRPRILKMIFAPLLKFVITMNKFVKMTGDWIIFSNPPDHTRVRSSMSDPFKPKNLRKLESSIERLVEQLLDEIQEGPKSQAI